MFPNCDRLLGQHAFLSTPYNHTGLPACWNPTDLARGFVFVCVCHGLSLLHKRCERNASDAPKESSGVAAADNKPSSLLQRPGKVSTIRLLKYFMQNMMQSFISSAQRCRGACRCNTALQGCCSAYAARAQQTQLWGTYRQSLATLQCKLPPVLPQAAGWRFWALRFSRKALSGHRRRRSTVVKAQPF